LLLAEAHLRSRGLSPAPTSPSCAQLYGSKAAQTIANAGGRGTFFVNGNNYGCIYDRADQIKAAYAQGHTIGSHTWSRASRFFLLLSASLPPGEHLSDVQLLDADVDITKITASQLIKQLDLVEGALKKIIGAKPRFFRPPYGAVNDAQVKVLQQRGYTGASSQRPARSCSAGRAREQARTSSAH